MRKLLITGGAGFIGANFVHYWARQHPGDRLVVLDALTYAGNPANLEGLPAEADFRLVHGDICDQPLVEQLLTGEKIDTIVHFAAESHVDRSITGPEAFIQTNIVGTHTLLLAAKKLWRGGGDFLFHHVSTDEVYGSLGPND
ncbi:MAG TPA: NAD-dependent epimerase/dehydratase family protein, partial [Desulfurivibrio alkaliphilus]|nr:NAD-dependent epimerase/dehydratase family protein [Desulfurivibrio alkaliphilus]